jgi:hypothetical protein
LESNYLLVQASSGLEKLMGGSRDQGMIKESLVAQISAFVYYQSNVLSKLPENKAFKNRFNTMIFDQIDKDFGEYIDAKARVNRRALHHVYEWDKTGISSERLFKLNKLNRSDLAFAVSYEFLPSKSFAKGGKRRHVFVNKAAVMEAGMPLKIAPRFSERIVFDVNGYTVYMPKGASVTVSKPGGAGVKNSFESAYKLFFTGNLVNLSIKKSGFQRLFNSAIKKSLIIPASIRTVKYSFSPNSIRAQADLALTSAFGGGI